MPLVKMMEAEYVTFALDTWMDRNCFHTVVNTIIPSEFGIWLCLQYQGLLLDPQVSADEFIRRAGSPSDFFLKKAMVLLAEERALHWRNAFQVTLLWDEWIKSLGWRMWYCWGCERLDMLQLKYTKWRQDEKKEANKCIVLWEIRKGKEGKSWLYL